MEKHNASCITKRNQPLKASALSLGYFWHRAAAGWQIANLVEFSRTAGSFRPDGTLMPSHKFDVIFMCLCTAACFRC